MQPWDTSNPLVIHDSLAAAPQIRAQNGMGNDPIELHQNLYACLRVGRVERGAVILERLTSLYTTSAPEVVDAHNTYLQALFELGQQDPKEDALKRVHSWYKTQMVDIGIKPTAHTFVTLLRAAMNFLESDAQADSVREYLAVAAEYGPDLVDEINASPDFTDEEWDMLIRLQPETYEEPPSVQEVQDLHVSSPEGRKELIFHGLVPHPMQPIKPVPQKGMGLDSLKQALSIFEHTDSVPYPHDMEGTQEEKDQAYAYARQLQMERDSLDAAVDRWRRQDEKLQEMGIHGVLSTKPIQAIMYQWYTALVPLFKEQIEHAKKVLSTPIKDNLRDGAHSYGAWLERCKPERLAALTVARALGSCIRGKQEDATALKISALSIAIGTDIQDYLTAEADVRRDAYLRKQRKLTRGELMSKLIKSNTGSSRTPRKEVSNLASFDKVEIPLPVRTKLGALCLELLLKSATLTMTVDDPKTGEKLTHTMATFHHSVGYHQGKKVGFIVPHHKLMDKLRSESVHSIHNVKLPMVVEPKPWISFEDGGYYTLPQKVVRQKSGDSSQKAYAKLAIENGDLAQVLAGLDVLGRVPWQINAPVLEVMAKVWNTGEGIGGLVPDDVGLQRPPEPPEHATYQERTKWARDLKEYENLMGGYHSQRCFQNFQLETARAFVNEKKIYFPHSVDFRGRAYPIPPILNHIGPDVSRGLLKFANGKELGTIGLQWLKIHLANLYGYDKASLREREKFAMDNINEVYDSATNPLGGRRWWTKAEDPWQCLACCIELKNALDAPDPTRYLSQLPVHQDGTCNGLQHYAALGGDYAGARQVNLEPSDRPQDIYTGVAELVKASVAKDAAKGDDRAQIVEGHITRKVVKRTVMTNVYGVTFIGAKEQVKDELQKIFPNFTQTNSVRSLASVALYVALKIFEALGTIFNGAQEIQYWLGECGDRITTSITAEQIEKLRDRSNGKPIQAYEGKFKQPKSVTTSIRTKLNKGMEQFKTSIIWTTPLKMPIVQPYRKDSVQVIKTKVQDITVSKRTQADVVDKRKQLQAFPPNFIHSLDATHMILSALECNEKGLDFAAVHDSFWTHASDIPNLNVILRDAFVRMHSEDIVGRLAAEFSTRYAGAMYRATVTSGSAVALKINEWRTERRKLSGKTLRGDNIRQGNASFEEVALEAERQDLLKSVDPAQRKRGEEMVTPTSIWLANPDPKALHSFRLNLIGQSKDKKSSTRQEEVRDKVLSAEADAINADTANADNVEPVFELPAEEQIEEDEASIEGYDASVEKKKSPSRISADRGSVQVWIPLTFPPVPKKGGWDVSRLRESKYFFS